MSAQLEEIGFSAYDAQGNLKPMVEIFSDLNKSLEGMSEQERYDILKNIFPTRSISAALAILDAMNGGSFWEIYENVGDSEGYAQTVSDIMMSGLTGAMELFYSKWEEFERKVGEVIAPWLETIAGWLGNIIDWLNSLDPVTLNSLVGGLTALAVLGPGLMIVGAGIKLIGTLGPVGLVMVGLGIAAGALWAGLSKLNEISFNEHFGELELDLTELGTYVDGLGTKFTTEYQKISLFETQLDAATGKYSDLVTRLNENLLTDVLTNKELTSAEQTALQGYADQIYAAVIDGIATSKAADMTFLEALFSDGESPEQIEAGNTAAQVMEQYYGGLYDEAYAVGEELRHQFTLAMADNVLDEQERLAIQSTVDRYNEIMAQVQDRLSTEAYLETLYDAQHVSFANMDQYMAQNQVKQDEEIAAIEELYRGKWAHYRAAYMDAIENGRSYYSVDGQLRQVSEEDWALFEAELEAEKQAAIQSTYAKYGGANAAAFQAAMDDSKVGDAWRLLMSMGFGADGYWQFSGKSAEMLNGMSFDEIMDIVEGLRWITSQSGTLGKHLGQDAQSELYKQWMDVAEEVGFTLESGLDPIGEYVLKNNEALASAQERLNALNAEFETNQRLIDTDYSDSGVLMQMRMTRGAYESRQEEARTRNAELSSEIAQTEAEINQLTENLNNLPTFDLSVIAKLDTSEVDNYNPATKYLNVVPHNYVSLDQFAEGGRATVASIFGEDGAEWAIPEEHSARTADLLNRARAASGFSWGDLISRYGGLNGGGGGNVTLNYAPVINAANADGVAGVLA
ncbi:MAG: phage tail tape measure protein, partial [Clostridia bacterium]|nr:phage tail tape measure protein [Clostridia bacterium]